MVLTVGVATRRIQQINKRIIERQSFTVSPWLANSGIASRRVRDVPLNITAACQQSLTAGAAAVLRYLQSYEYAPGPHPKSLSPRTTITTTLKLDKSRRRVAQKPTLYMFYVRTRDYTHQLPICLAGRQGRHTIESTHIKSACLPLYKAHKRHTVCRAEDQNRTRSCVTHCLKWYQRAKASRKRGQSCPIVARCRANSMMRSRQVM